MSFTHGVVFCLQLFSSSGGSSEQDHYLHIADGFMLVYEITSKASFDLVMAVRQKISSRSKDVSGYNRCHLIAVLCQLHKIGLSFNAKLDSVSRYLKNGFHFETASE